MDNNTETTIQVVRMNQIFGNATEVLTYLGTRTVRTVSVIRDMDKLGVTYEEIVKNEVVPNLLNPLREGTIDDNKLIHMFDF